MRKGDKGKDLDNPCIVRDFLHSGIALRSVIVDSFVESRKSVCSSYLYVFDL